MIDYIIKLNSKLSQVRSWRLWGWWWSWRTGRRWTRWGTLKPCLFYIFLSDEMLKRLKVEVRKKTRSRWDLTFDKILMTFPVEDMWLYENDKNDDNEDEEEAGPYLWQILSIRQNVPMTALILWRGPSGRGGTSAFTKLWWPALWNSDDIED